MELRVRIDAEDKGDLALLRQSAAEIPGVESEGAGERGIAPILALVLVGSGTAVVGAVAGWLMRRGKHGLIVDLREDVPADDVVRTDKDIEFGYIIVLLEDGTVEVVAKNPENDLMQLAQTIFKTLAEGVTKPLDTAAKAVAAALGEKAKSVEAKTDGTTALDSSNGKVPSDES